MSLHVDKVANMKLMVARLCSLILSTPTGLENLKWELTCSKVTHNATVFPAPRGRPPAREPALARCGHNPPLACCAPALAPAFIVASLRLPCLPYFALRTSYEVPLCLWWARASEDDRLPRVCTCGRGRAGPSARHSRRLPF